MLASTQFTIKDFNDWIIQATAPSPASEGMLWLDTTENELKKYTDGEWVYATNEKANYDSLSALISTQGGEISGKVSQTTYNEDMQIVDNFMTNYEQTSKDITLSVIEEKNLESDIEDLKENFSTLNTNVTTYMKFDSDGLKIGKSDSTFNTKITNTEISFNNGENKVAYISGDDLYIKNARVTNVLSLGIADGYFDFTSSQDGLAIQWREV